MDDHPNFINRSLIVDSLGRLRQEWEEAASNVSLIDVESSVGLLLADLALAFDLSPEEQVLALGADLVNELQNTLVRTPDGNGRH